MCAEMRPTQCIGRNLRLTKDRAAALAVAAIDQLESVIDQRARDPIGIALFPDDFERVAQIDDAALRLDAENASSSRADAQCLRESPLVGVTSRKCFRPFVQLEA